MTVGIYIFLLKTSWWMLRQAGRVFRPSLRIHASGATRIASQQRSYAWSTPKYPALTPTKIDPAKPTPSTSTNVDAARSQAVEDIIQDEFMTDEDKDDILEPAAPQKDTLDIVLEQIETDDGERAMDRFSFAELKMFEDLLFKLAEHRNDYYLLHVLGDLMKSGGFEVEIPVPRPPTPEVPCMCSTTCILLADSCCE
jgi:hypothetical protein